MKKLATLTVWLDEDAKAGESSSYTHFDHAANTYSIFLRPKADAAFSSAGKDTPDILAHELGHFVAHVFELPAAKISGSPMTTIREQLAAEHEAWNLSEEMVPGITKKPVYTGPIRAYARAIKEFGADTPIAFATNETDG